MERSSSVPRPLAEQLLRRAVRMEEAERAEAEREELEGYTLRQLREAASESGVDPRYVSDAASALLREKADRSRVAIFGYAVGTGVAAAIAAAGLLASGRAGLAVLFIILDLLLVATVLLGLDDHLRRGMRYLQRLLDDSPAGGEPPRLPR